MPDSFSADSDDIFMISIIKNYVDWVNDHGADTKNCEIKYNNGPNNRGVYAAKGIEK